MAEHEFTVSPPLKEQTYIDLTSWHGSEDCIIAPGAFCSNSKKLFDRPNGAVVFKCLGHDVVGNPAVALGRKRARPPQANAEGGLATEVPMEEEVEDEPIPPDAELLEDNWKTNPVVENRIMNGNWTGETRNERDDGTWLITPHNRPRLKLYAPTDEEPDTIWTGRRKTYLRYVRSVRPAGVSGGGGGSSGSGGSAPAGPVVPAVPAAPHADGAVLALSKETFVANLWNRRVQVVQGAKPSWLITLGIRLDENQNPKVADVRSRELLEQTLAVSGEYIDDFEFNGSLLFRNRTEIPMPSVAYSGMMILIPKDESGKLNFNVKHSGFNAAVAANVPFEIDPSATITVYEETDEFLGIVWYNIRSETCAPALRELNFPLRPDSYRPENLGEVLKSSLTTSAFSSYGIDRQVVERLTKECPDFGTIWHFQYLLSAGMSVPTIRQRLRDHGHSANKINEAVNSRDEYDFQEGVLYKIQLLPREHSVTLRVCVPRGAAKSVKVLHDLIGVDLRRELILWHHASTPFGMHSGLDATVNKLSVRFTWPDMIKTVENSMLQCVECRKLRGKPFVSPSMRADLFEGPFHCLFFDHVGEIRPATKGNLNKYLLTCVCAFSGWGWAVPVPDKSAQTTAHALMTRIFCDISGFPMILRHDRSSSFLSEIIEEVNKAFGMKSIVGTSWRPQSQGKIESQHKKLSQMLKVLCEKNPEDWDEKVPFAVWAWRTTPQPSLGGLSPYRIITGTEPRTPFSITTSPVGKAKISTNDWVNHIIEVHEQTNRFAKQYHTEQNSKRRDVASRRSGTGTFVVGDFVLVLRPDFLPHTKGVAASGRDHTSAKLLYRTFPEIYVVNHKLSDTSYVLKQHSSGAQPKGFENPVHLQRLIPVSLWETKTPETDGLNLGIVLKRQTGERRGNVIAHGYLGNCRARFHDGLAPEYDWVDLTKEEYSWVAQPPQ